MVERMMKKVGPAKRIEDILDFPGVQLILVAISMPIIWFGCLQFFLFGGQIPHITIAWYPYQAWIPFSLFMFCHIQATAWIYPNDDNWIRRSVIMAAVWFTFRIFANNVVGVRGFMNGVFLYIPFLIILYVFTKFVITPGRSVEALEQIQNLERLKKQSDEGG